MWQAFLDWYFAPRQLHAAGELSGLFRQLFSAEGLQRAGALLAAIFEIFGVLLFDAPRTPRGPALDLAGYHEVFRDDFDGGELDLGLWEHRATGPRSGGYIHPGQVRVEGGKLILKAEYLEEGARGAGWPAGWYSGMINTAEEFTYGYFEMTCTVSKGGGFSSAWWMNARGMASAAASQGGVGGAELDIMEAYNHDKPLRRDSVGVNVHVDGYGPDIQSQQLGNWRVNHLYTEMNTFGLLWTEEEYIFYINGVEAVRSSFKEGASRAPEYAIISLEPPEAEGFTERPGFAAEFVVDSVRILQKD
jgi:hypothetical protein